MLNFAAIAANWKQWLEHKQQWQCYRRGWWKLWNSRTWRRRRNGFDDGWDGKNPGAQTCSCWEEATRTAAGLFSLFLNTIHDFLNSHVFSRLINFCLSSFSYQEPESSPGKGSWDKNNSNNKFANGSESPKSARKRFGSASEDTLLKVNGVNEGLPLSAQEMEAFKAEIIKDVRREFQKMKQEIVEGLFKMMFSIGPTFSPFFFISGRKAIS